MSRFSPILLAVVAASMVRADVPATGSITGTFAYEADPERPWRYQRYYVRGKKGPLAEAVVAIEGEELSADADRKPAKHVMDQKDFRFVPETLLIRRGDEVEFTNSDPHLHNVFTVDLTPFNVNTPIGESVTRTFPKAGNAAKPMRIGCIYHSNMTAYLYVFDHPFHALTPAAGTFAIENVPPGTYDLIVAHPAGRLMRTVKVTVTAGSATKLEVTLTPDDLPRKRSRDRESDPAP